MALDTVLPLIWFFLPAAIANMFPVIFKWVPLLDHPVDLGRSFRGKRIFGNHKTYRGFLFGVSGAIAVLHFQKYINLENYSLINYGEANLFVLGFLFGFGALLGDLLASFAKRQSGISPGKSWIPFDQTDWIMGACLFTYFVVPLSLPNYLIIFLIFGLLHPVSKSLEGLLKL